MDERLVGHWAERWALMMALSLVDKMAATSMVQIIHIFSNQIWIFSRKRKTLIIFALTGSGSSSIPTAKAIFAQ